MQGGADAARERGRSAIGRRVLYWAVFVFFIGLTGYGFWSHPGILGPTWSPSGKFQLLVFSLAYAAIVAIAYILAASRLPLILAILALVAACGAVGIGGPLAALLFLASSFVLGAALMGRSKAAALDGPVEMILATLLGASLYMTAIGWTAGFAIHYRGVYAVLLVLPFLIWPRVSIRCLTAVGDLLKPQGWTSLWHYGAFALAAFIPLVHLVAAVLLPQVNSDAVMVHLAVPSIMGIEHAWPFAVEGNAVAAYVMGTSWMILPSYLLGGEFAARLVNFAFFVMSLGLAYSLMRRFASTGVAWLLTAVYASTPFFLVESGNIFAEGIWVAMLLGAVTALDRFHASGRESLFLTLAVLAAASLAVKILGVFLLAVLFGFVLRECLKRPIRLAWILAVFALVAAHPYVWAYVTSGNPVFPFMNQIFQSPFFPPVAFAGVNRPIPSGLYDLTFETQRYFDNSGLDGSFGFQYLVLLPLGLLALGLSALRRRYPYLGWVALISALVFVASVLILAEANIRYFYPALPLGMILVALAYAQARELSRPLYGALCVFGVAVTLLNIYAMPVSAWAHRDFSLSRVLTGEGIDAYRDRGAPERRVIDYLNLTRGRAVRVAFFARPMLIDLEGEAVFSNWYGQRFHGLLAQATTADAVLALMREEKISKFIAFRPETNYENFSPAVAAFLEAYTEPEFSVADVYLARYKDSIRFSESLIVNGDFAEGLAGWRQDSGGAVIWDAASRTVSVTERVALAQRVQVSDRVVYRYSITVRCATADTHVRIEVIWQDDAQRTLEVVVLPQECDETFRRFAAELTPPAGATLADVYVSGHEADKAVEVSEIDFAW